MKTMVGLLNEYKMRYEDDDEMDMDRDDEFDFDLDSKDDDDMGMDHDDMGMDHDDMDMGDDDMGMDHDDMDMDYDDVDMGDDEGRGDLESRINDLEDKLTTVLNKFAQIIAQDMSDDHDDMDMDHDDVDHDDVDHDDVDMDHEDDVDYDDDDVDMDHEEEMGEFADNLPSGGSPDDFDYEADGDFDTDTYGSRDSERASRLNRRYSNHRIDETPPELKYDPDKGHSNRNWGYEKPNKAQMRKMNYTGSYDHISKDGSKKTVRHLFNNGRRFDAYHTAIKPQGMG